MKKSDFLKKIQLEEIVFNNYSLELDQITDAPNVIGCVYVSDMWKIFKTTENTGHYIIKEFADENSAFDYFYSLCKLEKQRENH